MELLAPIRGARRVFRISQGCLFEEINNQNGVKPLRDHVPLEPLGPDGREPSILSDPTNIRTGVLAVASPAGKSKLCIIIHWPFKKWNTSDFKCKTSVCMYVSMYVCMYIYIFIIVLFYPRFMLHSHLSAILWGSWCCRGCNLVGGWLRWMCSCYGVVCRKTGL